MEGFGDGGMKGCGGAESPAMALQEHDAVVNEAYLHFSGSFVVVWFAFFSTDFLKYFEGTRSFLAGSPSPLLCSQPFTAGHHEKPLLRRELDAAADQSINHAVNPSPCLQPETSERIPMQG